MPHFRSDVNGATVTTVADENPDPDVYVEVEPYVFVESTPDDTETDDKPKTPPAKVDDKDKTTDLVPVNTDTADAEKADADTKEVA